MKPALTAFLLMLGVFTACREKNSVPGPQLSPAQAIAGRYDATLLYPSSDRIPLPMNGYTFTVYITAASDTTVNIRVQAPSGTDFSPNNALELEASNRKIEIISHPSWALPNYKVPLGSRDPYNPGSLTNTFYVMTEWKTASLTFVPTGQEWPIQVEFTRR
jgi:hypothetical protein